MTDAQRTPTPIDTIADAWVDTLAEREPTLATYIGRFEHNGRFGDYSPEGAEALVSDARAVEMSGFSDMVAVLFRCGQGSPKGESGSFKGIGTRAVARSKEFVSRKDAAAAFTQLRKTRCGGYQMSSH